MNQIYIKVTVLLLISVGIGLLSAIGDIYPVGSPIFILGGFLNTASVWSLLAFFVGFNFRSRRYSILSSVSFLVASICSYYLSNYILTKSAIPVITLLAMSFSWVLVAICLGSLCGLAGMVAKHSKILNKRLIATIIPIVIVVTECMISFIQLIPNLSKTSSITPAVILIILSVIALLIPFVVFKSRRIAMYTAGLGLIVSTLGALLLMALSGI